MREQAPTSDRADATGWAADRLGIALSGTPGQLGVGLEDLVGLAVRRNPRRAHLLVSTVLGKHRPTDPDLIRGSALLLGALVARVLAAPASASSRDGAASLRDGAASLREIGDRLVRAVHDEPGAASRLTASLAPGPGDRRDVLVIGYAETATALGQHVADALGADSLSSTRREVPSAVAAGGFEEEHSHATSHRLLPDDPRLLDAGTIVLVDDELTTGTTVLNTVALLERLRAGRRYVAATLADLRSAADAERLADAAAALGIDLQVVALAEGRVRLPDDVLRRAETLRAVPTAAVPAPPPSIPGAVGWLEGAWPPAVRHHGRHGFRQQDRERFGPALTVLAGAVAARLRPGRIHVLGTEELMYLPQRLAGRLASLLPEAVVTSSATTRSPVVVVDEQGYPIRSALAFPAHDDPAADETAHGPGERFAYNLGPAGRFDAIVLVVDERGSTPQLTAASGLLPLLAGLAPHVLVVVVPDGVPEVAA